MTAQLGAIQSIVERLFQSAYELTATFQENLWGMQKRGISPLPGRAALDRLESFCSKLYELLARAMLDLVVLAQPEDCRHKEHVNLYFWPGYQSHLKQKRLFWHESQKTSAWNFGIGFCKEMTSGRTEQYYDSCQARWYQYLISPRNKSNVTPGDVHVWYRYQAPRHSAEPYTRINSLTVLATDDDEGESNVLQSHERLHLAPHPQETDCWGDLLSQKVNELGEVRDPNWRFPARQREPMEQARSLEAMRSQMTSIWLHSAFCPEKPRWLETFVSTLAVRKEHLAADAVRSALCDLVACDWGDRATGRPLFKSWSYLSVYPSLAPVPPAIFPSSAQVNTKEVERQRRIEEKGLVVNRGVGSAAVLCSIPLKPVSVSLIHRWVSTVYGMMRDAEAAILLHKYQFDAANVGMIAGPWFAHELKKLINDGLQTLLRHSSESTESARDERRFVLNSIRNLGDLAYVYSNGVLTHQPDWKDTCREEFLKPLRDLYSQELLVPALSYIAQRVYVMSCRENRARVEFETLRTKVFDPASLNDHQHCSCLMLVAEAIRTYCHSERADCVGRWSATESNSGITIELVGPTRAQRNPGSMAYLRLDLLLKELNVGSASVTWDSANQICSYHINVELLTNEPSIHRRELKRNRANSASLPGRQFLSGKSAECQIA